MFPLFCLTKKLYIYNRKLLKIMSAVVRRDRVKVGSVRVSSTRTSRASSRVRMASRQATCDAGLVGILRDSGKEGATGNRAVFSTRRNQPVVVERRIIPHRIDSFDTFWFEAAAPSESLLLSKGGSRRKRRRKSEPRVRFRRGEGMVKATLIPGNDESWSLELGSFRWLDENGVQRRRSSRLMNQRSICTCL